MKRIPECKAPYCPAPTDPDWHKCWICGAIATEHHHVRPRGMGGSKSRKKDPKNIVALCHSHHEMVTTGGWGCAINHIPGRGLVFWAWDLHGNTKAERVLEAESSAVERECPIPQPAGEDVSGNRPPSAAPPSVSNASHPVGHVGAGATASSQNPLSAPARGLRANSRAESAAAEEDVSTGRHSLPVEASGRQGLTSAAAPSALVIPGTMTKTSLSLPQNLSFEDWSDGITQLSEFAHHYQFHLGDAALYGENRWEEAWQTLTSLGLTKASVWNIMLVCQAIPPEARHPKLTFSHHVVVYKLDPEERDKWLSVAEASRWPIAEFRERVQGKPSRKKRWSLEELRELLAHSRDETAWYAEYDLHVSCVTTFFDWLELERLEEQGE